jgi:histidinol phosphatase-like enzyme
VVERDRGFDMMDINNKYIKSYVTEENLIKALKKSKIEDHRYMVVWNKDGRCTALFPQSNFNQYGISYLNFYGQFGFMVLG